jgi:hypothetical protein
VTLLVVADKDKFRRKREEKKNSCQVDIFKKKRDKKDWWCTFISGFIIIHIHIHIFVAFQLIVVHNIENRYIIIIHVILIRNEF